MKLAVIHFVLEAGIILFPDYHKSRQCIISQLSCGHTLSHNEFAMHRATERIIMKLWNIKRVQISTNKSSIACRQTI